MVVLLMGPPGCGKGTQSKFICEEFTFNHISTGDLIRQEIASGSERAKALKDTISKGELVSDDVIFALLGDRLQGSDNYLFDGIPRTLAQAKELESLLNRLEMKIDAAINFDVPDADIVKRLSGRLTCADCKSIFNLHFNPPAKVGVCDNCGGELVQRVDDTPEAVQNRLNGYHKLSTPVLDYLQGLEVLSRVDGARAPERVFADVEKILKKQH